MYHWFLVGRDIMWFLIGFSPLYLSMASVAPTLEKMDDGLRGLLLMIACLVQVIGIGCLYSGVIK